jgi:bile acid:Na+ symporter, BASS family
VSDNVTNLFPVWTVLAALLGLLSPDTFAAVSTKYFTAMLAALMLSMGITLTLKDFQDCLSKPVPVAINFVCCYLLMPALAFGIGQLMGLNSALMAGLVLVGSINGGQASNLCTYIAKGDVALSVVMTTSTTIGCIFMTPLIAKIVLGTIVPVDPVGIAVSTIQVVLVPVLVGVLANAAAPKVCRKVEPFCPLVGVAATVVLVGASVAQCSKDIMAAGLYLQFALFALHLVGGVAGYWFPRLSGQKEKVCRTVAIETAMKSSAFGFLLAALHFGDYAVRVPPAISVVWMAVMGASMAVYWRCAALQASAPCSLTLPPTQVCAHPG